MADSELVIRSYRLCFELERRIHSIDRWRIPVPYGVPLRGVAYGVATLAAVLAAGRVPGLGELLGVLHPALRLVILPVAVAYALTRMRVDGRPAHAAALSWARWRLGADAALGVSAPPSRLGPRVARGRRGRRGRPGRALPALPRSRARRGHAALPGDRSATTAHDRNAAERRAARSGGGKRLSLHSGQRLRVR